jgi:hypothetical protein
MMTQVTSANQPETQSEAVSLNSETSALAEAEKVLCPHCLRTATNGLKCKGICVADSDY